MRWLLALLTGLVVGCAEAPATRLFRDEPRGLTLRDPDARRAYDVLRKAERFESSRVGFGGETSAYAVAFRVLAERLDKTPRDRRRSILRALFRDATLPGQLYATAAFYFYDPEAFELAVDVLSADDRRVPTQIGCVVGDMPVAALVRAPGARIRVAKGATLEAAPGLATDIAGGSYPLRLRDETDATPAPRAPL